MDEIENKDGSRGIGDHLMIFRMKNREKLALWFLHYENEFIYMNFHRFCHVGSRKSITLSMSYNAQVVLNYDLKTTEQVNNNMDIRRNLAKDLSYSFIVSSILS